MGLHRAIKAELRRLGISHVRLSAKRPALELVGRIEWPQGLDFEVSLQRYRDLGGGEFDDLDDESLVDEMSFYGRGNLRFAAPEGFWKGWEDTFSGVDPDALKPFASNQDLFFFLGDSPDHPGDPLIFSVDHEMTDEEPSETNLTLSILLAILEPGEEISPPTEPELSLVAPAPAVVSQTPLEVALEPVDGTYPKVIKVDGRGLALGSGGGYDGERPYLDLGLPGLAVLQAELYPDFEGFWAFQDHGGNQQTVFLGHKMQRSKQFPVDGNEVALGSARFRWIHL